MSELQIEDGLIEQDRPWASSLYWEAFRSKLRPAFGGEDVGKAVVRTSLRPDRILVARVNGSVVGVCGYTADGVSAVDLSWTSLRSHLSRRGATRAIAMLAILARSSSHEALVLDGICVAGNHRGLGIGTSLLDAAGSRAREFGFRAMRLTVVDTNPRAEALYRRLGFVAVGGGSLGVLSVVYGFDRYTTMERTFER
ncbi:GNAT family N-acetyltransferase [Arthrobacter sp. MYb227]|uniref:GNAT family N-acetyltransferase n=1 Tax=Arthrobacter sp. MYb227 TaxID=1848601 RepID=UPI000CFC3BA6|nr:GNAT family N-acetyltransferase [Arthrobacter sp. MYb227]PQZ92206.1 GNAT family N-acetyltransferase [Arthrobacter sp. MYb227]